MTLNCRKDFPMLQAKMHGQPLVYLDSAATAQKPLVVIEAMDHFYRHEYATVHRAVYELAVTSTEKYHQARQTACRFLHAEKVEEIIFTRGTTESINLVATSFGKAFVQPGDEILITEMEHHSNIVPWQLLCQDRGAVLRVVPFTDDGELDEEAFERLLTPKVKLVSMAHVSNVLGTVNPIEKWIAKAHSVGAKILIDGAQAAPHQKVDVQTLGADFYVFSGHKMYGPTGIGVLYVKEELLEQLPPYQGGGDMVEKVTFEKTTYNTLPMRFEAGTPMIVEAIGLGEALGYLEKIGMEVIHSWEAQLVRYAEEALRRVPRVKILASPKQRASLLTFILEGIHPLDVGTLLDIKGVAVRTGHHCAQPTLHHYGLTAALRASFGLYNTFEDVDRWIEALYWAEKTLA